MLSSPSRPSTAAPGDGSRTLTTHDVQPRPGPSDGASPPPLPPQGILQLRGGPRSRPRVAWDEGVVDNENCGRKKSKICCIYHKPKEFDESSDESSDDESSDADEGLARPPQRRRHHHHHRHRHHHPPDDDGASAGGESSLRAGGEGSVVHEVEEDGHEPNAYESQPKKGKDRA